MPPAEDMADAWTRAAEVYGSSAARFTALHATDLLGAVLPQVTSARVVLELACGTGAFASSYLNMFPLGIPGQKVIFTDFSTGMVALTERYVKSRASADCQTTFEFRVEDATDIQSFGNGEVDVVVSIFGVFLVEPRKAVFGEIKRVLREGGTFATAAWTKSNCDDELQNTGFGSPFQATIGKAFGSLVEMDEGTIAMFRQWETEEGIREIFSSESVKFEAVFRSLHTTTFSSMEDMWDVVSSSPMIDLESVGTEKAEEVKRTLWEDVSRGNSAGSVFFITASNIAIATV